MADPTLNETLKSLTVDQINEEYRSHQITAAARNKLMLAKAHVTMAEKLSNDGYLKAVLTETVKNVQEGWENLKTGLVVKPGEVPDTKHAIKALWGGIQILSSAFTALGEVNGQEAENLALYLGASPGVARVMNFAANTGTQIFPVGKLNQVFVKGVQALQKATKGTKVVAGAAKAEDAALFAKMAIEEGLKVEGATDAATVVAGATMGSAVKQPWEMTKAEWKSTRSIENAVQENGAKLSSQISQGNPGYSIEILGKENKNVSAVVYRDEQGIARGAVSRGEDGSLMVYVEPEFRRKGIAEGLYDFADKHGFDLSQSGQATSKAAAGFVHKRLVRKALSEGKPVPPNVLADYPDLEKLFPSARVGNNSIAEQFAADYAKFHAEVSAFTVTQTHEQTAKMAKKLGLTLDDLAQVVPGTALNERQMYAYLKALDPQVDKLNTLARQAKALGTEAAENLFMQHKSEMFPLLQNFRFAETTTGRAVEILKLEPDVKNLTNSMLEHFNPEAMASGDRRGAIQTLIDNVIALDDAKNLKAATVQGQSLWGKWTDTAWPMIREGYINLLLPFAFIPSFVGNSIAAAQSVLERKAAGMFSTSKTGVVGDEAWHLMQGLKFSTADFMGSFKKAFYRGGPSEVGRLDVKPGAIPGVLGSVIRTPTNDVMFMDDIFKRHLKRASYYGDAIRLGRQEGLTGEALGGAVTRRVMHPTEDMMTTAKAFAEENTFQNELGRIAGTVKTVLQYGPVILFFPFMKSPINLVKNVWNRTPGLQLLSHQLYKDIGEGGAKADLAMGRLIMSQLQAHFVYQLAQEGFLTGSGPTDAGARKVWLATNEPYSVKTKSGFVPFANMDPATGQLGLIADFTQIMASLDSPTAEQATMAVTLSVVRDLLDKTWFPNVSTMIEVIQDIHRGAQVENKFGKLLAAPIVTVATGGPIGGRVRSMIDPVRREARGVIDSIGAKLPYFSKDHPPVRDAYGDPITPPQPIGGTFFGAFSPLWPKEKEQTTDRVKLEGEKIGAKIPPVPWSIGGTAPDGFDIRTFDPTAKVGVGLTAQERDDWQEFYRQTLRDPENGIEKQVLDNPDYQEQTPAMKAKMFEAFLSAAMTKAETASQLKHPDIGIKLLNAQGTSILPLLNKQDQEDAQQTVTESISLFKSLPPDVLENFMKYGDLSPDNSQEAAQ